MTDEIRMGVAQPVLQRLGHIARSTFDVIYDWRLGVETRTPRSALSLGLDPKKSCPYVPTGWRGLGRALRSLKVDSRNGAFLDVGCGKGRALLVALSYGFQNVIGVEVSAELCEVARSNCARRLSAGQNAITECADAGDYTIPSQVTTVFLYHPFVEETLARFAANLRQSMRASPREVTVIYQTAVHPGPLLLAEGVLVTDIRLKRGFRAFRWTLKV